MNPTITSSRASLPDLGNRPSHFVGFFKRPPAPRMSPRRSIPAEEWVPPADISEDDCHYTLKVELPDVRREDIRVSLDQGVLSVTGEYQFEQEDPQGRYHTVESAYGCFSRTFALPSDADPSGIHASFHDGTLVVVMDKMEFDDTPADHARFTLGGPLPAKLIADSEL